MRQLVITENITLDGVIEATEGWFAPVPRLRLVETQSFRSGVVLLRYRTETVA